MNNRERRNWLQNRERECWRIKLLNMMSWKICEKIISIITKQPPTNKMMKNPLKCNLEKFKDKVLIPHFFQKLISINRQPITWYWQWRQRVNRSVIYTKQQRPVLMHWIYEKWEHGLWIKSNEKSVSTSEKTTLVVENGFICLNGVIKVRLTESYIQERRDWAILYQSFKTG